MGNRTPAVFSRVIGDECFKNFLEVDEVDVQELDVDEPEVSIMLSHSDEVTEHSTDNDHFPSSASPLVQFCKAVLESCQMTMTP